MYKASFQKYQKSPSVVSINQCRFNLDKKTDMLINDHIFWSAFTDAEFGSDQLDEENAYFKPDPRNHC